MNGRLPGLVGPGDRRWSYAYVEDVAEGHALALEKGKAGERYVLGGENATLNGTSSSCSQEIAGTKPPRLHIPYAVASLVGRAQWLWAELTGHPPQLTHGEVGGVPRALGLRQREGGARARLRVAAARRRPARDRALAARGRTAGRARERVVSLSRGELARQRRPRRRAWRSRCCCAGSRGRRPRSWRSPPSSSTGRCCRASAAAALWRVGEHARAAIRSASCSTRSRCSRLILFFRDASGWRRRSGACWPWATAWRRSSARLAGGPRLPWNPRKGWAGLVAFVLFGAARRGVPVGVDAAAARSTPTRCTGRARSGRARARGGLRARRVGADDARRQPHGAARRRC